jgi:hypothetical protein
MLSESKERGRASLLRLASSSWGARRAALPSRVSITWVTPSLRPPHGSQRGGQRRQVHPDPPGFWGARLARRHGSHRCRAGGRCNQGGRASPALLLDEIDGHIVVGFPVFHKTIIEQFNINNVALEAVCNGGNVPVTISKIMVSFLCGEPVAAVAAIASPAVECAVGCRNSFCPASSGLVLSGAQTMTTTASSWATTRRCRLGSWQT